MRQSIVVVALMLRCAAPAYTQQCLHRSDEAPEQQARRQQAVRAARVVNTIQANQPGRPGQRYLSHEELGASPYALRQPDSLKPFNLVPGQEVSPGWELILNVTDSGYWFMIKDKIDPCGFAFISNTTGLIYKAEPIR
jgi:hypothetical protein